MNAIEQDVETRVRPCALCARPTAPEDPRWGERAAHAACLDAALPAPRAQRRQHDADPARPPLYRRREA